MAEIQLVADVRMPGVLGRLVDPPGSRSAVYFERAEAGGPWVPVWSGTPSPVVGGEAAFYDPHVRPGGRYAYRMVHPERITATIDVPTYPHGRGERAWVKPVYAPHSTMRVILGDPGDVSRESRWESVRMQGGGDFMKWEKAGPREWPIATHWLSLDDLERFEAAVDSGPMLVQTDAARHGLWRDAFAVGKEFSVRQYGDREAYTASLTLVACSAPAPDGAPLVIPGWSWKIASKQASTLTRMAEQYPSRWQLLRGGVVDAGAAG